MNGAFVSYEREDEARVGKLVRTRENVGPSRDAVRDEAGQAQRRGLLLPVALQRVAPPRSAPGRMPRSFRLFCG